MSVIRSNCHEPPVAGNSPLVNDLRKYVTDLDFSVSYTTRPPRGSEQDGREYHFVDRDLFEDMLQHGEFLEHAEVFGHYYGTSRTVLEEADQRGHDLLLDIDVQGAHQVKEKIPEAVSIFVLPPSRKELEARLRRRSLNENIGDDVIRRRLEAARKEIENYPKYDYILVNDRLEPAVDELTAIVLGERVARSGRAPSPREKQYLESAQKCLKSRMEDRIRGILASFS